MNSFPDFAVSCGEEGSDPTVAHDGSIVRVDQFAASGHFERQDADLAAVRGLGVELWRYGMPWRLTEPEPGRYDWTLWDRALETCAPPRVGTGGRRIEALAGPSERVVAGHDFYPVSVTVHGERSDPLTIHEHIAAYEREATAWRARYTPC